MSLPAAAALLVSLAALFSYLNYRFVRLPSAIGLMLIALVLSLGVLALGKLGIHFDAVARDTLARIDFDQTVMTGMLSFLLFAGALHIDLADLADEKGPVAFLAIAGIVISTALVGLGTFYALDALGQPVPLVWCLVFGALISPTDPIAVLAIIRSAGVQKQLEMKIAGESLFNDGVGVVIFLQFVGIATGNAMFDAPGIATFFSRRRSAASLSVSRSATACSGCCAPSTTTRSRCSLQWVL